MIASISADSVVASVNGNLYRFRLNHFKDKTRITVERLVASDTGDAQVIERSSVPLPHPAYRDGQWQPEYFEKLVKSAEILRMKSFGKKVR